VQQKQRDWDEWLPYALAAYRATTHEITRFSPNYVIFGHENRLPADIIYGPPRDVGGYVNVDEFVARSYDRMQECYSLVRDELQRAAERSKRRYDLRVRDTQFGPGDQVWYLYPRRRVGLSPKWQRWYDGPFTLWIV